VPETSEIIKAYDSLCTEGKPCALATVIRVEGSSYRRAGAKMLVAEDGRTWGGVSGGCLERDVARRARNVIATRRPVSCRYDADDEDFDSPSGLATGCGGVIHVFIQPLGRQFVGPLHFLGQATRHRLPTWIATVVDASSNCEDLVGSVLSPDEPKSADARRQSLQRRLKIEMALHLSLRQDHFEIVHHPMPKGFVVLAIELIWPPLPLVIFGDGPDVAPLVAIGKILGWNVTVVGTRSPLGLRQRFPDADVVCSTPSDDPTAGVEVESDSAVVVMTHNVHRDRLILQALPKGLRYLGVLGPRHRTRRLMTDMVFSGLHNRENVFTPVGLDLGSRTPQEIALSIVAEIQAVISHAPAGFLRDKSGPIHERANFEVDSAETGAVPFDQRGVCPVQA
jgi:xanthine/CO dehydrogenase XdhC/CoxF family maturation factor